jgi:5-methylcytosine-specific restriction endonuclease McrA
MARKAKTKRSSCKTESQRAYKQYLGTSVWLKLRNEALRLCPKCSVCGSTNKLAVHHKHYPDVWGTETQAYLQVLCSHCHDVAHSGVSTRKRKSSAKHISKINATVARSNPVKVFTPEEIIAYVFNKRNQTPQPIF